MFKCLDCNKVFKYDSEFERHKNRKISCIAPKKNIIFMSRQYLIGKKDIKNIVNYLKIFKIEFNLNN